MKKIFCISLLVTIPWLHSCQSVPAYKRGILARENMQLQPDGQLEALRQHRFASKEAASGGYQSSGGGCGCN